MNQEMESDEIRDGLRDGPRDGTKEGHLVFNCYSIFIPSVIQSFVLSLPFSFHGVFVWNCMLPFW